MPGIRLFLAPLFLVCLALACGTGREPDRLPAAPPVETLEISVTGSLPHDTGSFTQGLFFLDGLLFESTGNYGSSMLRVLDHSTGELLRSVRLDPSLFGEGCCLHGDTIYQLTWKEHVVLLYDPESLERIGELEYETEGWGICSDGESLIMSDGTSYLYFRDPRTFALAERVQVTCGGRPLEYINEMEYV
ncbi:glutaminyl-peptide cyclotransferase, partial [Candidatus Fermentibacterales bacterium]|nr:glutaminyl-peptide cyclotransferase [Candidatus Fermentibacterales bacterium]